VRASESDHNLLAAVAAVGKGVLKLPLLMLLLLLLRCCFAAAADDDDLP